MLRMHVIGLALAVASLATWAVAQQAPRRERAPLAPATQPNQPATRPQPATQPGQPQKVTANRLPLQGEAAGNDRMIAQMLAIDNEEEIAMARLAASKTSDRQVREFAERLIKDHTALLGELGRFGAHPIGLDPDQTDNVVLGEAPKNQPAAANDPPSPQREGAANGVARNATGRQFSHDAAGDGERGGLNPLSIKRQVAQMCLANAKRELSEEKSGHASMSYIGHQIPAHEKMIVVQQVLRQYASPELQRVLDHGIETAQAHLDEAKQLIHSEARQDRAQDATRQERGQDATRDRDSRDSK